MFPIRRFLPFHYFFKEEEEELLSKKERIKKVVRKKECGVLKEMSKLCGGCGEVVFFLGLVGVREPRYVVEAESRVGV